MVTAVLLSLSQALRILVHIVLIHLLGRESLSCWEVHVVNGYVLHSDILVDYAVALVGRLGLFCLSQRLRNHLLHTLRTGRLLRIVVHSLLVVQGVCIITQLLGN